jgi:hypothetical protein
MTIFSPGDPQPLHFFGQQLPWFAYAWHLPGVQSTLCSVPHTVHTHFGMIVLYDTNN